MPGTEPGAGPPPSSRRPWEAAAPASSPWSPPPPDRGTELVVRATAADEAAAIRLVNRARRRPGGLGTALGGGLLMVAAVAGALGLIAARWKSRYPTGPSLLAVLGLIALFASLGWFLGARAMPWLNGRLAGAAMRRRGGPPPDGGGEARILLGERALHWSTDLAARRFDAPLLSALVEDDHHMVLRFGLALVIVLPRRDLSGAQAEAVRQWAGRHAREGAAA